MIVVLDTNIWLKELALNSGVGSAFRFFLKQRQARLALPEVVRLEVQHNLRALVTEAIDHVNSGNRRLLALFGSMKEIVLPNAEEIEALISGVFTGLRIEIMDVSFSLESARSSFLKTIQRVPPSDKTQEFKDGVLWADCLRLLEQDDVLFASHDKAFCASREYGKGLAENLLDELKSKAKQLTFTHSIAGVLAHVQTEIHIDKAWFASVVRERAHSGADGLLSRAGTEVSGEPRVRWELFATENPELLYFTYDIEIPCTDLTGAGRTNIRLLLDGTGTFRPQPPEIAEARTGAETLTFTNVDGTVGQLKNIYAIGNVVIGHRTITHAVRHRLDGSTG
jgi:hypothetical protein